MQWGKSSNLPKDERIFEDLEVRGGLFGKNIK
jgi:hypothetical protein